jgi:hypothetical protein
VYESVDNLANGLPLDDIGLFIAFNMLKPTDLKTRLSSNFDPNGLPRRKRVLNGEAVILECNGKRLHHKDIPRRGRAWCTRKVPAERWASDVGSIQVVGHVPLTKRHQKMLTWRTSLLGKSVLCLHGRDLGGYFSIRPCHHSMITA